MIKKKRNSIRAVQWAAAVIALASAAAVHALPNITAITETGGEGGSPSRYTGQVFTHPNYGANYRVPTVREEVPIYNDRNHELTGHSPGESLPAYLLGAEIIQNDNDARDNTGFRLEVTLSIDSKVYILIDNRTVDADGSTPPDFSTGAYDWLATNGWTEVKTGLNRNLDNTVPDEVGLDEGASGAGPGEGLNQWYSIYERSVPAGRFTLYRPTNAGQNMFVALVKATPVNPAVIANGGDLNGFTFDIANGTAGALNTSSVEATLNGAPATLTSTTADGVTTFRHAVSFPLTTLSSNGVTVVYADAAGARYTNNFSFNVERFVTVSAADTVPASAVNTSSSGFTARVVQARTSAGWPSLDLPTTIRRAEEQLAGVLIDPLTGTPLENFAVPGPNGGAYLVEVINWNQEAGDGGNLTENGNFQSTSEPSRPEAPIPGVPGTEPQPDGADPALLRDNIAAEITGYLQLPAGLHRFGVNSDDGFRLTIGGDTHNVSAAEVGQLNAGRGAADSLFYVNVLDAGIYPVRLVWFEGGGGGNIEFFSMSPTGVKTLINDRTLTGAISSYATAAAGSNTPDVAITPYNGLTGVYPNAKVIATITDRDTAVTAGSIVLRVNGQEVQPTITKSGAVTTVTHTPTPTTLLPSNTSVPVELVFTDTSSPARSITNSWSFNTVNYASFVTLSASSKVPASSVDLASSGFNIDVYHMPVGRSGFTDNNSSAAAERQIARGYIDPATGMPYENLAVAGTNPDGTHAVEVINFNQAAPANTGGFNSGNGFEDQPIPGVEVGDPNNIAAEAIAYLELKAGVYQFGVNSDDGFKVSSALDPRDQFAPTLGIFNTGRGSADTLFGFVVPEDGIYPIRLLWWEGTGGGNVEFFAVDPNTGARALVNDRNVAFSPKAYRTYTGPARPLVRSVSPIAGATGQLADAAIEAVVSNVGNTPVSLIVNDQVVATTTSVSGTNTTIRYVPTQNYGPGQTNRVGLVVGTTTNNFSFVVQNYITLPAGEALPISAADQTARGFLVKVVQANVGSGATARIQPTTLARAESQLAGTLIDPDTTQPFVNQASAGSGPNGSHILTGVINWSEDSGTGTEWGSFRDPIAADQAIPGIDVSVNDQNIAAEVLTYLDLPAGLVNFGVNSDDGFRLAIGQTNDTAAPVIGLFDAGRGANDSLLSAIVPVAGLYPVRLVWFEGSGDANLEFFTIVNGEKVLVNSDAAGAVKAYYRVTQVARPTINSTTLSGGNITIQYSNGTLQAATSLNGTVTWADVDSDGSYSEPATAPMKFFRVRQ